MDELTTQVETNTPKHRELEPESRLCTLDQISPTDIDIADPSITIVEVGETLGILLAESCRDNALNDLQLETVAWIRCTLKQDWVDATFRLFDDVTLYHHNSGLYVAQEQTSKKFFPLPSVEPYRILFITQQQYTQLHQHLLNKAYSTMLTEIIPMVEQISDFWFDGYKVVAPSGYADSDPDEVGLATLER